MGRAARSASPEPGDPEPFLLLNRQRKHPIERPPLVEFLRRLSDELDPGGSFSVVLVSDRAIRAYNRTYRGRDKPTDVLSFPGDGTYLGDILISTETAYNQVLRSSRSLNANLKRLALHGLLHLMGHDHETDDGEMRVLELRLRRRFRC